MNVNAKLVEKTSDKTGKKYVCIEIQITPTYTKLVFLTGAEIELLKVMNSSK